MCAPRLLTGLSENSVKELLLQARDSTATYWLNFKMERLQVVTHADVTKLPLTQNVHQPIGHPLEIE